MMMDFHFWNIYSSCWVFLSDGRLTDSRFGTRVQFPHRPRWQLGLVPARPNYASLIRMSRRWEVVHGSMFRCWGVANTHTHRLSARQREWEKDDVLAVPRSSSMRSTSLPAPSQTPSQTPSRNAKSSAPFQYKRIYYSSVSKVTCV